MAVSPVSGLVAVYIHAHQDDWQLFMGDRLQASTQAAARVVVIYTTAGDGGGMPEFWQTRERAAQESLDAMIGPGQWACGNEVVADHPIWRCVKGIVSTYSMRLPDGNINGAGFGKGSLDLLRDQNAPTAAIDGSTTYASWSDFYTTIRSIIELESSGQSGSLVEIHAPEWRRDIQRGDHPDHLATADAVRSAVAGRTWTFFWYLDYWIDRLAVNLGQAAHDLKQRAFWAYDDVMIAGRYGSNKTSPRYPDWLWRTYYRTEVFTPTPPPPAPSALLASASTSAQINLSWSDNATNESGFHVERAPDVAGSPGNWEQIAILAPNIRSYASTGLTAATVYWHRVRAYNAGGTSGYSNEASAATLPPPATPTDLAASATSSSAIQLVWQDVATNETGYEIERAPDAGGAAGAWATIATVGPNASSFLNLGLSPTTSYWYRVRAIGTGVSSSWSNEASATTPVPTGARLDVYFAAYQSDWQLFMGDKVAGSIQGATKTVVVHTTAGDAGGSAAFWQARERAAQAAVNSLTGSASWTCAVQTVVGHGLSRCVSGTVVLWYMRIPDGGLSGTGFSGRGSLSNLRDLGTPQAAIDGSTTYASWADFYSTLTGIVSFEAAELTEPTVEVHAPDWNREINRGDQPDRWATADAMRAALATRPWTRYWYVQKYTYRMPVNLEAPAHDVKQRQFWAYDDYMAAARFGSEKSATIYSDWLWRTYYRTEAGATP